MSTRRGERPPDPRFADLGSVKLPLVLAELGLLDELSNRVDLKLVGRLEYGSGAVAMRYEPRR
jgi:hypothetical protein